MALETRIRPGRVYLKLGSGDPVVYAQPCALLGKGFQTTKSFETYVARDCDDPDLPGDEGNDLVAISRRLTASGMINEESLAAWAAANEARVAQPVRYEIHTTAGGIHAWTGLGHVKCDFDATSPGSRVPINVEVTIDGAFPYSFTAPPG